MAICTNWLTYYAWHIAVYIYWTLTIFIIKNGGINLNCYVVFVIIENFKYVKGTGQPDVITVSNFLAYAFLFQKIKWIVLYEFLCNVVHSFINISLINSYV